MVLVDDEDQPVGQGIDRDRHAQAGRLCAGDGRCRKEQQARKESDAHGFRVIEGWDGAPRDAREEICPVAHRSGEPW